MPHIEDRVVHDADAHTMETRDWLEPFADPDTRDAIQALYDRTFTDARREQFDAVLAQQDDPAYRAQDEAEFMARKNHDALGSFRKEDRPRAIDLIGVASQLVFPTTSNVLLERLEHESDRDLLYGLARASNRAQTDFCSVDARLLPVCNVPLADIDAAGRAAREAIGMGAAALLIPWACPRDHATSHVSLDPVWAAAQEAGIPILLHVGAADFVLPAAHANNGLPEIPDFHGGDENFRSVAYMAIPSGPHAGAIDADPRRRAGSLSALEGGRDRARCGLAARLHETTRGRDRGIPATRTAPPGS